MTTHASVDTIDTAQASRYRADGFLVVRQVFSAGSDRRARCRGRSPPSTHRSHRHQQHPLPLAERRRHRRVPLRLLRSGDRSERRLRTDRARSAPARHRRRAVRRAGLSLQGQADLQGAGHAGLQPAPGLHLLEIVPDHVPDRDRGDRRRRRGQRGDRSVSRLSPAGLPHASRRHVSPAAGRCGGSARRGSCSTWRPATSRSSAATRRIAPGRTARRSGAGCCI